MPRLKPHALTGIGIVITVALITTLLLGLDWLQVSASPLPQFPINSVTIISDPPPPALPGQFSENTLLRNNLLDPDPLWRSATFDDSGWQPSYPVVTQPTWGPPVGGAAPQADFIWGGPPGTPSGGRFNIPATPAPQFLFLRKNFCIPINAQLTSIAVVNPFRLQVAATPGRASFYYNGAPIALNLAGDETGFVYSLNLTSGLVNGVRRIGRNTLAMRVRDDVADTRAAVAYSLQFNYAIDPNALVINSNPASPATVNTAITFSQINNGLSGDGPFTFAWDFGDGTTSTAAAPTKVYNTPGTYNVMLTMTDRFGCPSAPATLVYQILAATSPSANEDEDDGEPPPPTPLPSPTPTVLPSPTPTGPLYLPETGLDQPQSVNLILVIMIGSISIGSILLLTGKYLHRRWRGWHN